MMSRTSPRRWHLLALLLSAFSSRAARGDVRVRSLLGDFVEIGGASELPVGYTGCARTTYDCGSKNITLTEGYGEIVSIFAGVGTKGGQSSACPCIPAGTAAFPTDVQDDRKLEEVIRPAQLYTTTIKSGPVRIPLLIIVHRDEVLVYSRPTNAVKWNKTESMYHVHEAYQPAVQAAVDAVTTPTAKYTLTFPTRICPGLSKANGQKMCKNRRLGLLDASAEEDSSALDAPSGSASFA